MSELQPKIESIYIQHDPSDTRTHIAHDILVKTLADIGLQQTTSIESADSMVVIGGDGTLIHAMHEHNFPQVPIRGINTGTIGFFMSTDPTQEDISELVTNLKQGTYSIDELSVLDVRDATQHHIGNALNDAVIRSSSGQALHVGLTIASADFGKLTSDGVIVSTASGSTGYAKSAGGSFIHEAIKAYEVVPLNPYYSPIDRPAIVPADLQTTVVLSDVQKRPYQLTLDGMIIVDSDTTCSPQQQDIYHFSISPDTTVQMIRFDGHEYFKKLAQKIREIHEYHTVS